MTLALAQAQASPGLGPLERLELLCDEGSLRVIRSTVETRRSAKRRRPGDGVVGASGAVTGRPIFCYAQDGAFAGGSLGQVHAETVVRVLELAGRAAAPVVAFVESGGARMDDGVGALAGYARIFRHTVALTGFVPQISVVTGCSAGGGAYSPALTDFIVMTAEASMFLTGPGVVQEVTGEAVTKEELGGPQVHGGNGVCHFVAADDRDAGMLVRDLLAYLPRHAGEPPPREPSQPPAPSDVASLIPEDGRRVYDIRDVIRALVDRGDLLEVAPRWARNMVTAFCRIDGLSVGVVANQPRHLGGVIDADASQKTARFVDTCSAFGLPLVVLVDTPGFLPGTRQEAAGIIRHGARLVHAFAAAEVPKLTVVLRKAYGGGFITMNSKDLGADLALAWPGAEIGIMGARQAVAILHRRDLAVAPAPARARDQYASAYAAEHLSARAAARGGHVDELIKPAETRERLEAALAVLGTGRDERGVAFLR
jgi:acetyl-CoA carboxylase carboxyltransferase component